MHGVVVPRRAGLKKTSSMITNDNAGVASLLSGMWVCSYNALKLVIKVCSWFSFPVGGWGSLRSSQSQKEEDKVDGWTVMKSKFTKKYSS
jgi:hypothetical protein